MTRLAAMAAAALCLLALVGCGGNAEAHFRKDELRPLQLRIQQEQSAIAAQLQVSRLGRSRDARAVGALVGQLSRTVRTMGQLSAPDALRSAFHRYVVAHRHLVAALKRFARLLAGHSQRALDRQATAARYAAGEVARARDALDAA